MSITESDINFTSQNLFMDSDERAVHNLYKERDNLYEEIDLNNKLIAEKYDEKYNKSRMYHKLALLPVDLIDKLYNIRDRLRSGLLCNIGNLTEMFDGKTIGDFTKEQLQESLAPIVEPVFSKITDLMSSLGSVVGVFGGSGIPLIEEIPEMFESLAQMAKAYDNLPEEVKKKIEADNKKKKADKKINVPPVLKNLIVDIIESIEAAVKEWQSFFYTFWIDCISALLDLLQVVFDFFGIEAGFPLNILEMLNDIWKELKEFGRDFKNMLWDYLIEKVMMPVNAIKYLNYEPIDIDLEISALELINVKHRVALSGNALEIDLAEAVVQINDDEDLLVKLNNHKKNYIKRLNSSLYSYGPGDKHTDITIKKKNQVYKKIKNIEAKIENTDVDKKRLESFIENNVPRTYEFSSVSADIVARLAKEIVIKPDPYPPEEDEQEKDLAKENNEYVDPGAGHPNTSNMA